MGQFGGYYKGEKKKKKKQFIEQKANQLVSHQSFSLPQIEILKKGKK